MRAKRRARAKTKVEAAIVEVGVMEGGFEVQMEEWRCGVSVFGEGRRGS